MHRGEVAKVNPPRITTEPLSALTILATVLNFTAHFSNGEYLSWKAFNRISLATLLSMTVCIFAWMIHSRAGMLSSLQLVENNLGNMALLLLGSMFVVYQEFILFKNVLSWIGRKALPMDLSYSLYAILVPLVVMIIKIPFSSPLDMFPKNNIWGALCFDFGFWHFMTHFHWYMPLLWLLFNSSSSLPRYGRAVNVFYRYV